MWCTASRRATNHRPLFGSNFPLESLTETGLSCVNSGNDLWCGNGEHKHWLSSY
jgi:hypothetical protein